MDSRNLNRSFTCYFCNKLITSESEVGHATTCSRVLESCSYKCGAYVSRKDMPRHKRECVNAPRVSLSKSMANLSQINGQTSNHSTLEKNYNRRIDTPLPPIPINNAVNGQQNVNTIKDNINSLNIVTRQLNKKIEDLLQQNTYLLQWKSSIDLKISQFNDSFSYYQKSKSNTDAMLSHLQEKTKFLNELHFSLNKLKESFLNEQALNRKITSDVTSNLNDFSRRFEEQIANTMTLINIQKVENDDLKLEIEKIKGSLEEQKLKLTNTLFDLRATSQIASGTEEKIEIQDRENKSLLEKIEQLRLDVENLERYQHKSFSPGKILWKISEIRSKVKIAKETNCYYKSPIFYTHEYGYKIRLLLYLNGLNKWKDRYALIRLDVLEGDYDMMLKWPCQIEGTVMLRDLESLESPKHFSKSIISKRESPEDEADEPQESSSQFIFIPHSTILKDKYIQNNTMFVEVNIDRIK